MVVRSKGAASFARDGEDRLEVRHAPMESANEVRVPITELRACHCKDCQKASGQSQRHASTQLAFAITKARQALHRGRLQWPARRTASSATTRLAAL